MRKPLLIAHINSVHQMEAREADIIRNTLNPDILKVKAKNLKPPPPRPHIEKIVPDIRQHQVPPKYIHNVQEMRVSYQINN